MAQRLNYRCANSHIYAGIFFLAILLRLIFALQWQAMPYGKEPILDARSYNDWAFSILNGHYISTHAFYQSPLYPYLLALAYKVAGHSLFVASFLNAVLDSCTAAILSMVSLQLFGRAAGIMTGLLAAACAPMIFYTAPVMKESTTLFLFSVFLYLSLKILQKHGLRYYALCGLAIGLAILARGNAVLLALLLPCFSWKLYKAAALRGIALFFLAIALAVFPVTWHNFIVAHDFVPLTYDAGFNFYIGHSPYANGINSYPPEVSTDPEQERLYTTWIAEHEIGKKLLPSEVSTFWQNKAIAFAIENPLREIKLVGIKVLDFCSGADSFDNYDITFIKKNFPSLLNWPLVNFSLLVALAALAAATGWAGLNRDSKIGSLFIICNIILYMASVVLFYVTDRYRLPVMVFLLPLAGKAIPGLCALYAQKSYRRAVAAFGVAALVYAATLYPPANASDLSAFDWGTLTTLYADAENTPLMLDAFHKGTAISQQDIGSQAYIRVATLYEKLNQPDNAAQLLDKAATLYPRDGVVLYNIGRHQALQGKYQDALATLRQAQQFAPTYGLNYFAMAKIYNQLGDTMNARKVLTYGLSVTPDDPWLLSLKQEWRE